MLLFGAQTTHKQQMQLPTKEWCMQYNTHLQGKCCILAMDLTGDIIKMKCSVQCVDGASTS